jgi:transposase
MISDLVPDNLWDRIAPMLPPHPQRRHRYAGRHRTCDRIALGGIIFVLRTGVTWRDVPRQDVGCSGVTAWRRLRDWTEAGVWPRLHAAILTELRTARLLEMDELCSRRLAHPRPQEALTLDHLRLIEAAPAASITSSSTGTAPHSQCH